MPPRRTHTKSHFGCYNCRKLRVKCNEDKTGCGRCVRTGQICSLLNPNSTLIIINGSQTHTNHKQHRAKPRPPPHPATQDTVLDHVAPPDPTIPTDSERTRLRLMHNYACWTCKSLAQFCLSTEAGLSLWRDDVPAMAFEYDFLLHGLLSISALQLALSESYSEQHANAALAIQHHNLGIASFRSQLTNISAGNLNALFAFSMLVALHCFGIHLTILSQHNSLAKIYEVLILIRGSSIIAKTGRLWLAKGPFSVTFIPGAFGENVALPRLRSDIEDMLLVLSSEVDNASTTIVEVETYNTAISALRRSFVLATAETQTQTTVILFPIMVHPEFLQLTLARDPLALAILANYSVILYWGRAHIWLQGWGEETIGAIENVLPQKWKHCIRWATEESGVLREEKP